MKKICLTLVGIYLMMLHVFGQYYQKDTTTYKSRPLKIDEINLVSSYYSQNGNHSPVTGGIGTEKVTDIANGIDVKWVGWDAMNNKHTLTAGLGFDHHTSASSTYVSKTGASKTGGSRLYPSVDWLEENTKKGTSFGLGLYVSKEYNYSSFGINGQFSKKTKNNGEFTGKLSGYFDRVKMIYPSEFVPIVTTVTSASGDGHGGKSKIPSKPRTTGTLSLSFSQVINKRMQGIILLDGVYQNGYLGLPFHRVYFNNGSDLIENLPSNRLKLPIGIRLNYFLGDKIILRSYYRYYIDSWGLQAHTASLEVPYKITPFISVAPFYRYYTQTAVKYFAPYETHVTSDEYYTSNYSLSAFNSQFFGINFRLAPPKGIFPGLSSLELRYGHYSQTTDLVSDVISLDLKFK
ncbi:MAG TPA: DUF3570 domain-containing protein [Hanamia sp.]